MSKNIELHATSNPNRQVSSDGMNEKMREQIEQRAYELYEERGGTHGHDVEDWILAESEILNHTTLHRAA